jgi:hypothetical protein
MEIERGKRKAQREEEGRERHRDTETSLLVNR